MALIIGLLSCSFFFFLHSFAGAVFSVWEHQKVSYNRRTKAVEAAGKKVFPFSCVWIHWSLTSPPEVVHPLQPQDEGSSSSEPPQVQCGVQFH